MIDLDEIKQTVRRADAAILGRLVEENTAPDGKVRAGALVADGARVLAGVKDVYRRVVPELLAEMGQAREALTAGIPIMREATSEIHRLQATVNVMSLAYTMVSNMVSNLRKENTQLRGRLEGARTRARQQEHRANAAEAEAADLRQRYLERQAIIESLNYALRKEGK